MKIQLDFDMKIIKVENKVNLFDFVTKIKNILPDWKIWHLECNTVINNWTNPIVIDRWHPYTYPYNPVTWEATCGDNQETTGVLNLEVGGHI